MQPRDDLRTYEVTLSLKIEDPAALWTAAAQHAMLVGGMSVSDIVDTLGSANDPQMDDCILMLVDPTRFGGCAIAALSCDRRDPGRSPAIVEQHVATILPAVARSKGASRRAGSLRERFG